MFSHESMQTVAEGIFWFFVLVTFCGAILAVSARTLIRRVAGLALCFTGVAGIYYYLSSPFVAFMQMLVYVGALCVTITFAIMLAETSDANRAPRRNKLSLFLGAAASCAITACCATRENTIFISQADRQTIKFWFDSVVDRSN